jgi:hypothetical protein
VEVLLTQKFIDYLESHGFRLELGHAYWRMRVLVENKTFDMCGLDQLALSKVN